MGEVTITSCCFFIVSKPVIDIIFGIGVKCFSGIEKLLDMNRRRADKNIFSYVSNRGQNRRCARAAGNSRSILGLRTSMTYAVISIEV